MNGRSNNSKTRENGVVASCLYIDLACICKWFDMEFATRLPAPAGQQKIWEFVFTKKSPLCLLYDRDFTSPIHKSENMLLNFKLFRSFPSIVYEILVVFNIFGYHRKIQNKSVSSLIIVPLLFPGQCHIDISLYIPSPFLFSQNYFSLINVGDW